MDDQTPLERFRSWIDRADRILMISHEKPDGDTLSSALALGHHLTSMGKHITYVSRDPVPRSFKFLPGSHLFQTDFLIGDHDLIIASDCGDARRTGFDDRLRIFSRTKRRLVNIDQHPRNDLHKIANLNLVDLTAAATTQVIYGIFQQLGWPITSTIATNLLCGLYTDTGGFRHPNTSPEVLEIAADLLGRGGRLKDISRHLHNHRSVAMLKLWGIALDRLQINDHLGIVSSIITLEDLRTCEAEHQDLAGVVNLIKTIPNMKIAILFAEQPDGSVRASLRTESEGVDVSRVAALFGGGGLKKSGGFTVTGKLLRDGDHWDIIAADTTLTIN